MAGRVPLGSHRGAVDKEMEAVFVQNLKYAADILSKVSDLFSPGLLHISSVKVLELKNFNFFCRSGETTQKRLCRTFFLAAAIAVLVDIVLIHFSYVTSFVLIGTGNCSSWPSQSSYFCSME